MGFVSGLLGTAGGVNGTGISGPQNAAIQAPASSEQAGTAYDQTQQGIQQQQAFIQALQAQNGIGNQSNVYNQLQGVADGTGPNPAQAQLAQSTAANTANQAALMASQRGAAANTGLIARQAAMQGAANQQQAAGQAASMQAQQSLGALGQMGSLATNQVGQQAGAIQGANQFAQGQQQNLLNAIANQNSASVNSQGNVNTANAGLAGATMTGQQALMGQVTGAVGAAAGIPMPAKAEGGMIEAPSGPKSHFGKYLMAKGGPVPALVSPGEKYLSPDKVAQVQSGANPMAIGETIPGKPKVGGAKDSYANDNVHKTLQEGGIVIPRSVTQGADAEAKAMAFVRAVMAKQGLKR